ncbi:hypothetical protein BDR07DRAFT_1488951 [Suillus spraguei]|nr:hypothetical protein BDR07DRAFT_1488951 [Suillus spraguei]
MSRINQQPRKTIPQPQISPTVQDAPPKTTPRPIPPSISFLNGRTYFYLKNVDALLFSATQTIATTPDDAVLKYTGPLFQRLATIHIVTSGSTYALSEKQKISWKWLENTLHHATSTFSIDSILPLQFAMLPLPSYYGYLRNHKKQSDAI